MGEDAKSWEEGRAHSLPQLPPAHQNPALGWEHHVLQRAEAQGSQNPSQPSSTRTHPQPAHLPRDTACGHRLCQRLSPTHPISYTHPAPFIFPLLTTPAGSDPTQGLHLPLPHAAEGDPQGTLIAASPLLLLGFPPTPSQYPQTSTTITPQLTPGNPRALPCPGDHPDPLHPSTPKPPGCAQHQDSTKQTEGTSSGQREAQKDIRHSLFYHYQAFCLMQSTWETLAAHPTASQPHPAPGAGDALDYLGTQSWGQQPRGFSSQHGVMLKGISSGTCCARGCCVGRHLPDTGRSRILQPCPCQKASKITQGVLCCPDTFKFIEHQMQSPQLQAEIMQLGH